MVFDQVLSTPVARLICKAGAAVVLAALGVVLCAAPTRAGESSNKEAAPAEEIDHLAIAARLIRDGHHDRAETVLGQVDLKQPGLALDRYHTLLGLVKLELGQHAQAITSLKRAIAHGQTDPVVHSYMAQAFYGLERYDGVIFSLDQAGDAGRAAPGLFLMRARSHWELRHPAEAIAALRAGKAAFPDAVELDRAQLSYLIEMGLFQEVARLGSVYLSRSDASADDFAVVAEGLRRSKQLDQAKEVLESARLRFPDHHRLTVLLAHTYMDAGNPLVAAMLFEDAARFDPKLALEAAELYLKAGRVQRAVSLNARVGDQKAKIKQRLSILLELERYEEIAAMQARLSRLGLLEEQNIRYALAYACFKSGQFDAAEAQLKHLTDPRLFEQALELRRAMHKCREAGWLCH